MPSSPQVVVHSEVLCVWVEFGIAAACWWGWWTGVRVSVGKADLLAV